MGTVRSGPSVPPVLSLQGRYFINVEIVRRGLLDQAFSLQSGHCVIAERNFSLDVQL